ncbi:MAG: DUF983 domain-containing protein [Bacteroidota bacterium]|jgi:uncharacterized protein (DUF983 family)
MDTHYRHGKSNALLHMKCPQCQSGNMFSTGTFRKKFMHMNTHCEVCHLNYEIEPGFYWGAMYVSYAITVAIMLVVGAAVYFIGQNPDSWVYLSCIIGSFILASPFTYRYARVIMLYYFSPVRFDENLAKKS